MNGFVIQNKMHIDIMTDYLPVLSTLDYVNILLEYYAEEDNKSKHILSNMFPNLM